MKTKNSTRKEMKVSKPLQKKTKGMFYFLLPMLLLVTVFSWQCKKDDFQGETKGICPEVVSTNPINGSIDVVKSKRVSVTFNEVMDASTINTSTFVLMEGTKQIKGSVSYSGKTATFLPAGYLASNKVFTATVTKGAMDPEQNAMRSDYVWSFTTGNVTGADQPVVIATEPYNGEDGVAVNRKITAEFDKAMNATTINAATFKVMQGTTTLTGVVSYQGTTATFTPAGNLASNTEFTAMITMGAQDQTGNTLDSDYSWTFKTGSINDNTSPIVFSTNPDSGATNVTLSKVVSATFNETMDQSTINAVTFFLKDGINLIAGNISYKGKTAYFTPSSMLLPNKIYMATVTTGAKDLAGNGITSDYKWTFTTGTTQGQATVDLNKAGNFVLLAGSGITNTGLSIVNGNIGTTPTGTVDGFPPGTVHGSIHAADPIADQAKLDLTTAYNDAQGRSTGAISLPGNLSGLTLTPGLYSNSSSVILSAGNVTFDAQGDENAIFILKMSSTLTTTPGTKVILSGGAQAKNIFWSVGTSATLGTNSVFCGNILADQSISLNTGAILNGRALTRVAAITLQSNIINKP